MQCISFKASIKAFHAPEEAYPTLQRERQALQKMELGPPTTSRLERWAETYRHKYHRHSWAPAYSRLLHDEHSNDSRFGDRRGPKQARWRPRSVLPIWINFGRIAQNCVQPETSVQKGPKKCSNSPPLKCMLNLVFHILDCKPVLRNRNRRNRNFFAVAQPKP